LRRDRDALPGLGEFGGEARELDHVAASLLGQQDEELAAERLAHPARVGRRDEGAHRIEARRGQPRLEFRPSFAPAPVQQLHERGVIAHIVVVRRELKRALKIGEGVIEPPEPVAQIAAIGERRREVLIERDGGVEVRHRRVVAVAEHQRRAARMAGERTVRL